MEYSNMATITVDTSLMVSEAAWIAYNDGVQAFLRLRNAPLMRSSESISDALRRASASFIGLTEGTIEFSNPDIAAQFYGCLKRALDAYSPSLANAIQSDAR